MENGCQCPVADALSHPLRKAVVQNLVVKYLPISVPSFATYLALSRFPNAETDDFEEFRSDLQQKLTATHLPKLDEANIIDYDPDLADGVIDEGRKLEDAMAAIDQS